MNNRTCKFCGNPVTAPDSYICNKCHNDRKILTEDLKQLTNKFLYPRKHYVKS